LPHGYDKNKPFLSQLLEPIYGKLWIVHRLDKDTSGLLVLARNANAHRFLNDQFANRKVKKIYHALVWGDPDWEEKIVRLPLRVNVGSRHRSVVDVERGKPAETACKVLLRMGKFTLIEAHLKTGRRHQIRTHLFAEGLPIVSDALYGYDGGGGKAETGDGTQKLVQNPEQQMGRLGLHARLLEFTHPSTGRRMRFVAPYPSDFRSFLAAIASKR